MAGEDVLTEVNATRSRAGRAGAEAGGEAFCEDLEGDGPAGSAGAGDEAVAVGEGQAEDLGRGALADEDTRGFGHQRRIPLPVVRGRHYAWARRAAANGNRDQEDIVPFPFPLCCVRTPCFAGELR